MAEFYKGIKLDNSRDSLLTQFGKATLKDRYMLEGETFQEAFARASLAYASNLEHAQRIYDYASKLHFMFSTPILSNGGTEKGLPISCYLNQVPDSREGLLEHFMENGWLASQGGGIGCVDGDTEFLTENGWKKIRDYSREKLCVIDYENQEGTFEDPIDYINKPVDCKFYKLYNGNYHMIVSENHRNFVFTSSKIKTMKTTRDLVNQDPTTNRFVSNFKINGTLGLPYTKPEIQFLVALAADGHQVKDQPDTIRFGLTRHRKIVRLKKILETLNIKYSEKENSVNGEVTFLISDYGLRKLPLNFYNFGSATLDQLETIVSELGHWDGSFDHRTHNVRFSTMKKDEADFVQYAMLNVFNTRVGLGYKQRDNEIVVRQTNYCITTFTSIEETMIEGNQYCFTTRTGLWLARKGNFVFITGNSNWSDVRSNGSSTSKGGRSTGIIPFMHVADSEMLAFSQGNTRRGSYAAYLDISHPEILEFIQMRKPTGGDENRKNLNLHHGVNIPDKFMENVKNGLDWDLIDPNSGDTVSTVSARDLWQQLLELRVATGEPYFHFIDRSNEFLPQSQKDKGLKIRQSNLCTEITLPTNEQRSAVCCLSSINLEYYDEWKSDPNFIPDIIEFLDNVITDFIKKAPSALHKAVYSASQERSLGLGAMGLHSYLQKNNVPFAGPLAVGINKAMFKHIEKQVDETTIRLAKERGPCPDSYGDVRNMNLTAIAPNASSSIICGTTSPSIEPYRANAFTQKTMSGSFLVKNPHLEKVLKECLQNTEEVWTSIITNKGSVQHLSFLDDWQKSVFKTAIELDQHWIIHHAADRQEYIDQAQSVNLFFPADVDVEYLHDVHFLAWKRGLKSLYYLRSETVKRAETIDTKVERKVRQDAGDGCVACEG